MSDAVLTWRVVQFIHDGFHGQEHFVDVVKFPGGLKAGAVDLSHDTPGAALFYAYGHSVLHTPRPFHDLFFQLYR